MYDISNKNMGRMPQTESGYPSLAVEPICYLEHSYS